MTATVARRLLMTLWGVLATTARAEPPSGPLGSTTFQPSPRVPIGWRGDNTGRYPGAKPPTAWERTESGGGYTTKGIAWMTPLPTVGVSSPIVVGDRVFLTGEVSDLICLDKRTGTILWIRSNPEFEGIPADAQKAEPAYAQTLAPLASELAKVNDEVVESLNARMGGTLAEADAQKSTPVSTHKKELEKKIADAQNAIDKKLFNRYWGQAVFGFSGPTPVSDGKHVLAYFTTGVTACYDLDGNRKWIARGGGNGSEHGNFASPILCDGRMIVWGSEMRAYDVETGKLAWAVPAKAYNTYGSLFRVRAANGDLVACFQWGYFTRVSDGQPMWEQGVFGDCVSTPIVEGDTIFAQTGYPKFNDKVKGLKAFRIPPGPQQKFKVAYDIKENWTDDELPVDKQKNPFDRGFVASPLCVDGLIYQVTQGGGLLVNDAATGQGVYRKVLPLKPRTHYWDWAGASASPTMAGKYIYLMDNQGTTLIIEPGRTYKEVAHNVIQELRDRSQAQNLATPVFEGTRMYYRTPGYLYCIGE